MKVKSKRFSRGKKMRPNKAEETIRENVHEGGKICIHMTSNVIYGDLMCCCDTNLMQRGKVLFAKPIKISFYQVGFVAIGKHRSISNRWDRSRECVCETGANIYSLWHHHPLSFSPLAQSKWFSSLPLIAKRLEISIRGLLSIRCTDHGRYLE